ncbi:hypothetical protein SEA_NECROPHOXINUS_114 [Microbacterium phage Necrophoxinus]|nr:hypothetical protein SEA_NECROPHOXINUS_114 [Microbacterium phage Necrophoxinus]
MSTKIKVGDTVRIKENYPHAALTGNKIGAEFVVKEVVGDARLTRPLGYKFYVTGDAQGYGVWDLFIEKVGGVADKEKLIAEARDAMIAHYVSSPGYEWNWNEMATVAMTVFEKVHPQPQAQPSNLVRRLADLRGDMRHNADEVATLDAAIMALRAQGEPSDAQVEAAWAVLERDGLTVLERGHVRAALRAAGESGACAS